MALECGLGLETGYDIIFDWRFWGQLLSNNTMNEQDNPYSY